MQITRIEMLGFKSFSDRTVIHFDQGVTGIVGPNGCGKSNVVDAIFWVMGEQSAKHLRGNSMEDLIFNGSQKREKSSFCQVTMVVSREGVILPPEYDKLNEVQITRRLHRSGESEYLLNNIPCRLRDIQDIFLGTGVGTKAYSIIEQGAISKMVNAKPEDRRGIIEEAAGITKYKKRRQDCTRKIEGTQQNLLRIKDIILEKEKRLASLERQAKKAEKYKVVRDRAKALDLALSSKKYLTLSETVTSLRTEFESLQAEEASFSAQTDTLSLQLEQHRLALQQAEQRFQQAQNDLVQLTSREGRSEKELALIQQNIESQKKELARLETETEHLEERLTELETDRESLDATAAELRTLFEETESAVQEKVTTLEQTRSQLVQTENEEKSESEARITRIEKLTLNKTLIEQHKKQISEIDQRATLESERLKSIEQQQAESLQSIDQKSHSLKQLSSAREEALRAQHELQSQLKTHEETLTSKQKQLKEMERDFTRSKTEWESLKRLAESFEGFDDGVRYLASHKPSECVMLSDILEVPPELLSGVETLLGMKLQCMVVPNLHQAQELGHQLRAAKAGRGQFVPTRCRMTASGATEEPIDDVLSGSGRYLLRERIGVKTGYEPIADSLFNHVIVVPALGDAIEMWEGHPELGHTLLTEQGDVLDPSGWLTTGALAQEGTGVLFRRQQLSELEKKVEEYGSKLALFEPSIAQVQKKIDELKVNQEATHTHAQELDIECKKIERDIEIVSSQKKHLDQNAERLKSEISSLENKKLELLSAISQSESDSISVMEQKQNETLRMSELHARIQSLKSVLSEQESVINQERIRLAQAQEKWNHAQERLEEKRTEEEDLRSQISWNQEQRESTENHITEGLQRKTELEQALLESTSSRKDTEESLSELREAVSTLQEQSRTYEVSVQDSRTQRDSIKEKLHAATLKLQQMETDVRLLTDHLLERYHVDVATIDHNQAWDFLVENYPDLVSLPEEQLTVELNDLRQKMGSMGDVNVTAIDEYDEVKKEYDFLSAQRADLETALSQLEKAIGEMDQESEKLFTEMFHAVNEKFHQFFPLLFGGGSARLELTDPANLLESGVDIIAQPPGKKLQSIGLLSGGEKALTAVSLIFSIFSVKPAPFCLLDEVDAPLDDANVGRFNTMIRRMSDVSQFILITHNKRTMEMADILYGVTMEEAGVSRMTSIRLS